MRVEKSVIIHQPVETVFAFVTDMRNVKLWLPVKDIHQISSGPMGVGARFAQTIEFMGQIHQGTIEVTAFEVPSSFAFILIDGPFPLSNAMTFAPIADGTQLSLVGDADPGRALKLAGPLLQPLIRKQMESQVSTLKRLLETPA